MREKKPKLIFYKEHAIVCNKDNTYTPYYKTKSRFEPRATMAAAKRFLDNKGK